MDGVVADFRANALRVVGLPSDTDDQYLDREWQRLRDNPHLFLELPLMPRAHELVNIARQYRDHLGWELLFLTAIPRNNDLPWAFHDKAEWVRLHFSEIPVHFGPYSQDKHLHCTTPGDILVDDRADNCSDWTRAGGLAFKVGRTLDATIEALIADLDARVDHVINQRRLILDIL